jgi:hypothetical protein
LISLTLIGIGPALSGALFTWGVEHDYIITPWWTLGLISIIGCIPVFFLVEMDGLNSARANNSDENVFSDSEDEELLQESAIIDGDEVIMRDEDDDILKQGDGGKTTANGKLNPGSHASGSGGRLRVSSPIGMRGGSVGAGRRFSNGLGQTDLGAGAGGTTFIGR